MYDHNFDLGNFNFLTGLISRDLNDKYSLAFNGSDSNGTLVVLLNNDLTVYKKVLLYMKVSSVLLYVGGCIFGGSFYGLDDAVVMSLNSNLDPVGCPTIIDTTHTFTFEEDTNSPLITSENSTINFSSSNFNELQNETTPTTDADLTEDITCRASW